MGIRTSSTTASAGVIGNYGAGTTTELSKLYLPLQSVNVSGATTGEVAVSYPFTLTVNPVGATAPYTYTITGSDDSPLTVTGTDAAAVTTLHWNTPGVKQITVVAANELSSVSTTHTITLVQTVRSLYLPLVVR